MYTCINVPIEVIKEYKGSGRIAPLILDLNTGWKCVVRYMSRPFTLPPPGKNPGSCWIDWMDRTVWTFGRRDKSLALTGI